MIRMSDMSEQALALVAARPSRAELAPALATDRKLDRHATADDDLAIRLSTEIEDATTACDDLDAAYDLTTFEAGRLSRKGIERLARHVAGCGTCRILAAMIVAETSPAESTGTHAAAPERAGRERDD